MIISLLTCSAAYSAATKPPSSWNPRYEGKILILKDASVNNVGGFYNIPESGESFVQMDSEDLSFETYLDSNGVGEFVNRMEYLKEGFRISGDDQVIPEEDLE